MHAIEIINFPIKRPPLNLNQHKHNGHKYIKDVDNNSNNLPETTGILKLYINIPINEHFMQTIE